MTIIILLCSEIIIWWKGYLHKIINHYHTSIYACMYSDSLETQHIREKQETFLLWNCHKYFLLAITSPFLNNKFQWGPVSKLNLKLIITGLDYIWCQKSSPNYVLFNKWLNNDHYKNEVVLSRHRICVWDTFLDSFLTHITHTHTH